MIKIRANPQGKSMSEYMEKIDVAHVLVGFCCAVGIQLPK